MYHPDLPGRNPPSAARPADGPLWRGIKRPPISDDAFLSEAEKGNPKAERANPLSWGLSVWVSEEQADQGRRLFPYMRKWHIARGQLPATGAGVILNTPSGQNPHHHTWWKPITYNAVADFSIVMLPVPPT